MHNTNNRKKAVSLFNEAGLLAGLGRFAEAESLYQEAFRLFMESGVDLISMQAAACMALASVVEAQGRDAAHLRILGQVMLKSIQEVA